MKPMIIDVGRGARHLFGAVLMGATLCASLPASAATITPNDVYQVTEDIRQELTLLLKADLADTASPPLPDTTGLRPRHVMQRGQELLQKLATLRQINGLPATPPPPLPVREVSPEDVKGVVDAILRDIRELRGRYEVTVTPEPAPKPNDKNPNHVYANISRMTAMVDRLGVPAVVPNDVFQFSEAMRMGALDLHKRLDGRPPAAVTRSTGRKPSDVFAHLHDLIEALEALVERRPSLAIPGGITDPKEKTGSITPSDVLELLEIVTADIGALKAKVGSTEPIKLPPPPSGRTPTHSYDSISETIMLIAAIPAE